MNRYTPEHITSLRTNEIFVFGSNARGNHSGGAALHALMNFGAVFGQSIGLQGQSYAIVTMDQPVEIIDGQIIGLLRYAEANPSLIFLVTKIGCGIAGFDIAEIAQLFRDKTIPPNVVLPEEFAIKNKERLVQHHSFGILPPDFYDCDGY